MGIAKAHLISHWSFTLKFHVFAQKQRKELLDLFLEPIFFPSFSETIHPSHRSFCEDPQPTAKPWTENVCRTNPSWNLRKHKFKEIVLFSSLHLTRLQEDRYFCCGLLDLFSKAFSLLLRFFFPNIKVYYKCIFCSMHQTKKFHF